MTVRQVAADYSGCREVFSRYGETDDRPTKFGHLEPLVKFAARHGVPTGQLLAELAAAAGVAVDQEALTAQLAHRPFILAALILTLTLGAGWGAWLLFEIGRQGEFAAVSVADVVAHGETQLWGFIALFVMGIALRYLPMATSQPRAGRTLRWLILTTVLFGVIGGFLWAVAPGPWSWLGPASGAVLLLGAVVFAAFLLRQLGGRLRPTWTCLVLAAGAWLVAWAGITLGLRCAWAASGPGVFSESVRLVLMEVAIFGFALNAIYGFGLRLLSGFVGSGSPRPGAVKATFWLHNLGTLALVLAGSEWLAVPGWVGSVAVACGAVAYFVGLRGLRRVRRTVARPEVGQRLLDRYVQVAFLWLLAGLALLLLGDLVWPGPAARPPRAYLGAVRHGLTVGFMTTLIPGVGQRLLPVLGHTLWAYPRLAAPILILIAGGNLFRVTAEMATLWFSWAFAVMPASALLELAALVLFAAGAVRTLWPARDSLLRTGRVTPRTPVALMLAEHPWMEDILFSWGFAYLGRVRSVPAELTLGTLAAGEKQDPAATIDRVNALLRQHAERPDPLMD
jgi:hypothetical protein